MVCRIGSFIVQRHNELHDLIGGTEITEPLMLGLIYMLADFGKNKGESLIGSILY